MSGPYLCFPNVGTLVDVIHEVTFTKSKAKRFEELLLAVLYDVRVDEDGPHLPQLINEDSAYLASDARCIFLDASLAPTSI
ncbi:MAG: hypothetical protein E3J35_00115 [Methanomassiliicoccales archaeon]|nr:MAG: hypothetical protein E3J35_00115 [Methanomassiliicoccales archaeon]